MAGEKTNIVGGNLYEGTLEALDTEQQRAPAAGPSIYEQTLETLDAGRRERLQSAVVQSDSIDPERAAEARRLSIGTGIPQTIVERNFDRMKREAKIRNTPFERIIRETPYLAEFVEKPDHMKVAQDDLEQLGALEWLLSTPQRSFARGLHQIEVARLRTLSMQRPLTREEADLLEASRFHMNDGGNLGVGDSWFRGAVSGAAGQMPILFGAALHALKRAPVGAATGAAIGGGAGALAGGVGAAPGALAGAAFGAKTSAFIGAAEFGFQLEAGLALDEFLEFKDETGQRIDPAAAQTAALAAGALNAGLEAVGLGVLAKSIPGVNRLTGALSRKAVKQALRMPTVRAALVEAAKSYGGTLAAETAVETAQRAITVMSGELAKVSSGLETQGAGEIAADLANEAVGALQSFALLSLPGTALRVAGARGQAERAQQNVQFFTALGEGVAASKTIERMPEAAQEFLQRVTNDGPIGTVYAPVETWAQYWQSKGENPAEIAEQLTGDPEAFDRAIRTGEDLAIPTAAYAVNLAGTEHNAFFATELRLGPGEMNAREAEVFHGEQQAAAAKQAEEPAGVPTSGEQIRAAMMQQLEGAGVERGTAESYTQLVESAFVSMAERAGVDPAALFEQYGLQVDRPALETQKPKVERPEPLRKLVTDTVAENAETRGTAADVPDTDTARRLEEIRNLPPLELPEGYEEFRDLLEAERHLDVNKMGPAELLQALSDTGSGAGETPADFRLSPAQQTQILQETASRSKTRGDQKREVLKFAQDWLGRVRRFEGEQRAQAEAAAERRAAAIVDNKEAQDENQGGDDNAETEPIPSRGIDRQGSPAGDRITASEPGSGRKGEARAAKHIERLFGAVLGAAQQHEPGIDVDRLRAEFDFRLDTWLDQRNLYAQSENKPHDLLREIAKRGGIYEADDRAGLYGELEWLGKGSKFGAVAGVPGVFAVRKRATKAGQKSRGFGFDVMLQMLQDDPRWSWLESVDMLIDQIDEAARHGADKVSTTELPGTDELRDIGIRLEKPWWRDTWLSQDLLEDVNEQELEGAAGDTSFDPTEFGQGLFDDEIKDSFADPSKRADKLDTGEEQARLPGDVGAVRDEERKQGEFDLPFSLTSPVAKPSKKSPQRTLFQEPRPLQQADVEAFKESLRERFPGIEKLELDYIDRAYGTRGTQLYLSRLIIRRQVQKTGIGTEVMKAITRFADQYQQVVALTPAWKNEIGAGEPTSRGRLVKFYKRFGFVENKGTLADPTIEGSMYREPTLRPVREFNQAAWHGSPHRFEQFSLQKIGTGEGAQSYGWGLYFASDREVAEHYRRNLAGAPKPRRLTFERADINAVIDQLVSSHGPDSRIIAGMWEVIAKAHFIKEGPGAIEQLRKELTAEVEGISRRLDEGATSSGDPAVDRHRLREKQGALEFLDRYGARLAIAPPETPGRLYKVEIPESEDLLSWDVPASQQSEKVQTALRQLGVTWEPFKPKTLAQFKRWTQGKEFDRLWREDLGIREQLRYAVTLANGGLEDALDRWQRQHQGYFAKGMIDPTGEAIYHELARKALDEARAVDPREHIEYSWGAQWASESLARAGVPGLRYLDGNSRDSGEGSYNFVIFDDKLVNVTEFFQPKRREPALFVQHNLTERNLRHVLKMGGLAAPSLAIAKADDAITSFGEITLIGSSNLARPSRDTKVFGADVYSPRRPTVHFKIDAANQKKLSKLLKPYGEMMDSRYYDLDSLQKEGAEYLERSEHRTKAAFLDSKGMLDRAAFERARSEWESKGPRERALQFVFVADRMAGDVIRDNGLEQEFREWTAALFESLQPTEHIFRGFTNQGNRSYQPHTLENVVRILKRNIRGGESEGNIYGVGQLRSHVTPQFRTLKQVQDARDLIVSDERFDEVKEEVEAELFAIGDAMKPYYASGDTERFGYIDTVLAVMADAPRMGLARSLADYGFEDVPADVQTRIGDYLRKLRTLPTEYFEAKVTRAMNLGEFTAAVVPNDIAPESRAALERAGLQVETYERGSEQDRKAVIADTARSLGDEVLFQEPDNDGRRGSIRFGGDRQFTINLFERADLSTFLHESGHFFLEVFGDLADQLKAQDQGAMSQGLAGAGVSLTEQQKQALTDYAALLKWLGVESREQIGEEQHEQFARGFEAYLMEGKAPSAELRSAFSRFRAWLIGIYRSLAGLRVDLTPEVRKVFDRMLATDEAIAAAEHDAGVLPMFTDAKAAGMSEAEFALYTRDVEEASRTAREQLERQMLDEVQREQRREWKARRRAIREQVEIEVMTMPVYQALAGMQKGQKPDGSSMADFPVDPLKLSRDLIVKKYGAERLKKLPRPFIYRVDGGMDPDFVAQMFGFNSGDEMLAAVEAAPPQAVYIERETQKRMIAEQGSILLDGTLQEKAAAALAGEHRDRVIRAELRALWKLQRQAAPYLAIGEKALQAEKREREYERRWFEAEARLRIAIAEGRKQVEIDELDQEVKQLREQARRGAATINAAMPSIEVLREAARSRIAATRVRDLNPQRFLYAAKRASAAATDHAARQDFEEAIAAKQQELINTALFHEASRMKADVEKRVNQAIELGTSPARKRIGLAGAEYLDQVDGILDRYEFARVSQKALDRRQAMRAWVDALQSEGIPVDLSDEVLDETRRVNFREMTVEALVGVTDGLQHIVHLARLKNRLLKSKADRDLQNTANDLATSIREHHKGPKRSTSIETRLPSNATGRLLESFFAGHRKLASLAREMDGFIDGGPMWEAVIRPLNDAADREAELNVAATKRLAELIRDAYPGGARIRLYDMVRIDAIGQSLSKMGRIMIALNWGNEGNRQRVLSGYGWTEAQALAVLETLDARDWVFVQGVWDFIDSYWDQIAEKQQRVTGIAPEKVEALPVVTKFGTMRGGYFPIKYDDRLSAQAAGHVDLETANLQQQAAYVRATTRRGHTEARKRKVSMPVRADFGVIFEHVQQVVHDLSHHEMLIDVGRILGHRDVQKAIYDTYGDVIYRQFKDGLKDVAFGTVPATGGFEKAINHLRAGATIAGLAWNVTTAALQPLGLTQSIVRIGAGPVARGVARWLRSPKTFVETPGWIAEKSTFMRTRAMTQQREINELRNKVGINTGKFAAWIDEILETVSLSKFGRQDVIDSFFWMIQQMQRIADVPTWLGQYEKSMAAGESEERAIALADQAVLDSQGGGQVKDLASFQRGGPLLRLWTNFYSFFNTTYNLAAESRRRNSPGRVASDYMMLFIVPATLGFFLRAALRPGDDIEDDEWLVALARENVAYAMGMMLGLRELAGAAEGYAGYEGPAGARAFASAAKLVKQVEQGEADAAFWKSLNDTAGTLLHYPAGQVRRTVEGAAALIEGKTANPLALITGAPKE